MMYLLKISRTKKKSSDGVMAATVAALPLFALLATLTVAIRVVTASGSYGLVAAEFPLVAAPPKDPGRHRVMEQSRDQLTPLTPMVVLTTEAFFFGDLSAFSTDFADVRARFRIDHENGAPRLPTLMAQLGDWIQARASHENVPVAKYLVLLPGADVPMPIVIQVLAGLKRSPLFERIILGTGIL